AFDVSVLPLFRLEFPWSVGCLARLLWSHVGVAGGLGRGERLLLRVGRRGRNRNRWSCGRARLCRLRVRLGRAGGNGRRDLFADRLTVVVSDHHDDEFGLLGRNDLARHLRPFAIAALIVVDETGIGAMFSHDADFGLLGKSIFEPVGKPVSVRIAHHHDLDRGILARRGWRRVGVIRGLVLLDFSGPSPALFPLVGGGPLPLAIIPVVPLAITPKAAIRIITPLWLPPT